MDFLSDTLPVSLTAVSFNRRTRSAQRDAFAATVDNSPAATAALAAPGQLSWSVLRNIRGVPLDAFLPSLKVGRYWRLYSRIIALLANVRQFTVLEHVF